MFVSLFQSLRTRLPECLAVGVVDLRSGAVLACDVDAADARDAIDLVAATAPDLLRGGHTPCERACDDARRGLREALVVSRERIDVCVRAGQDRDHALVVLCRACANLGAVLAHARLEAAGLALAAR